MSKYTPPDPRLTMKLSHWSLGSASGATNPYRLLSNWSNAVSKLLSNYFATPWTAAHQAPLSVGFPGKNTGNGLPFPSPGDFPESGM